MNIYFACSLTGGRGFESIYQSIVKDLLENGYNVPTAYLADSTAPVREASIGPLEVYARDTKWIRECDVLIAEVSVPSHGVGYEIGFALELSKPVLAVSQSGLKVSKMITGNPDPNLTIAAYTTPDEALEQVRQFLNRHKKTAAAS